MNPLTLEEYKNLQENFQSVSIRALTNRIQNLEVGIMEKQLAFLKEEKERQEQDLQRLNILFGRIEEHILTLRKELDHDQSHKQEAMWQRKITELEERLMIAIEEANIAQSDVGQCVRMIYEAQQKENVRQEKQAEFIRGLPNNARREAQLQEASFHQSVVSNFVTLGRLLLKKKEIAAEAEEVQHGVAEELEQARREAEKDLEISTISMRPDMITSGSSEDISTEKEKLAALERVESNRWKMELEEIIRGQQRRLQILTININQFEIDIKRRKEDILPESNK
jgi:hypothetical protein